MREILFRGKTTSDKWVEGYVVKGANTYIIPLNNVKGIVVSACGNLGVFADKVIPETVCQYTGLTDKNGNKIFEGDILAFSDRLVYVNWHDYCGCWDCSYLKAVNGKATLHEDRSPNKWRYNAEVIGNIHDNPELLEA